MGTVLLVVAGLAFGLGVLVGRQRAGQTRPAIAADSARRPTTPRRGGLAEAGPEKSVPQEKLTFYQTLRAPLGPIRMPEGANAAVRPATARMNGARVSERASEGTPTRPADREGQGAPGIVATQNRSIGERSEARAASSTPREATRQPAIGEWTVQVGVFSSPQQAAGVKQQLSAGGFEAVVVPVTTSDGHMRYRVRLGAFRSRDEAVRTAERVRADHSLPTYVTTR